MRLQRILRSLALFAILFASAGCASMRGVSVGSEEANYSIDVTNTMPHSMTVSWSDGGETKLLGSVGSGRTERFIIAGAKSSSVSITARDANGTHNRSYDVSLVAGSTQKVTVR
jgi:hypothetical protein